MAKEEIIKALRTLKEKRLFSSEAEKLVAPLKGSKDSFNFEFIESSPTFGRQLDSAYDNGHQLIVKFEENIESAILISEKQFEYLNELSSGQSISMNLKFLEYDSLYQRAVFGKINDIRTPEKSPKATEIQTSEDSQEKDLSQEEKKSTQKETISQNQGSGKGETSIETNSVEELNAEPEDSKFNFPEAKPEELEETKEKTSDYYYVILEEVPNKRILKPDENEDSTIDQRTNITSYISNLVPEFKLTRENLESWSIKNFISLNKGWNEAKRLVDNCPALIKKTRDAAEAKVVKYELMKYDAITNILPRNEFIKIYGDPPKPILRKMVQIPVSATVSLNLKTLKRNPKDHLMNLRFMDLSALLLYCFGGLITLFGVNDFTQTFYGALILLLGHICKKGFKGILEDQILKNKKTKIYGKRWKTSIQYTETRKAFYINLIEYLFCAIGGIVIWSGITAITNLIIGALLFSFGRWTWPKIAKNFKIH